MKEKHLPMRQRLRTYTAAFAAIFMNLRWTGLDLRKFCSAGFNCHGCPYASFACPVGVITYGFSIFELPILAIAMVLGVGVAVGRLLCGYACPFGFFQDLLYKIPFPKWQMKKRLRWLKYVLLALLVVALPFWLGYEESVKNNLYYCRICPSGTLTASLPAFISGGDETIGDYLSRSWLRLSVLGIMLVGTLAVSRFFCRALCPLGAMWGMTTRFSVYKLHLDKEACINCGKCDTVCPVGLDVRNEISGSECISCGDCKKVCPVKCISRKAKF